MAAHLVFLLAGRSYALPIADVIEVLPAVATTPLPGAPRIVMGVLDVRGDLIPMIDLRDRLGVPAREIELEDQIVVSRTDGRLIAFPVEHALGVVEMLQGTAAQTDGAAVVVELGGLFDATASRELDRMLAEARS